MAGIVAKFGGSSLADAAQLEKVKKIIEANPERRYVVPSAPGKRHDGDTKVTDLLVYVPKVRWSMGMITTEIFRKICEQYMWASGMRST